MKIFKTDNFVSERLKINPVTNAEFDKIRQDIKDITNNRYKNVRNLDDAIDNYSRYIKKFSFDDIYIDKVVDIVFNNKIAEWDFGLSKSELIKTHKTIAKRDQTDCDRFIYTYCTFVMYGTKTDNTSKTIIKFYTDMLKKLYGATDKTITDSFFE
jgi:hypothetical protein